MKRKTNTLLAGLGLILAGILVFSDYSAESVSAYSATITTSNSIELDITPNGDGTSIHSESINVQSDCRAGYNMAIVTPEGSNLYKDGNSSNDAAFTSVDGTSALNSSNNTNKWGYTLTTNPTGSTVFSPLSTTQSVIRTTSQTVSPSADINDTFSINYGAKVSNTVETGSYSMANNGSIVYYLTMDATCVQYTVAFDPNGGTGNMDYQGIELGEPTKLSSSESLVAPVGGSYVNANNDTITGDADKLWVFWGWNTAIDGSGDWYRDKEEVEDLTTLGNTITLYAQWKQATLADMTAGTPVGTEKAIDHNIMQDMSPQICYNTTAYSTDTNSPAHTPYNSSTNPGGYHTATLNDYRGKVTTGESPELPEQYTVSKLPDNLCWMTKDLNLGRASGGANNNGTVTLTSEDTDLAADTTFILPASPTTYTNGNAGYYTPQILVNHAVTSYSINSASYSPVIGHYSWAAATATNTSITDTADVTTSICPKNWDLPTRLQFYDLRTKGSVTSTSIAHAAPYNLVYGGYRNGASSYYNETSRGYYWTSSNSGPSYGYWTYVYSSGIYNGSTLTGNKYLGAKIRCVANQGKVTINYDGNGSVGYPVAGSIASQENVDISNTKSQPGSGFSRDEWYFVGWNTAADGTGTAISANMPIVNINPKPGSTVTLYAQWLPKYTITYVNNCLTYVSNNASCTQDVSSYNDSQKINLDNNPSNGTETGPLAAYSKWTLTGWKIKGWSVVADNTSEANTEYAVSSTYTVPSGSIEGSGVTLYAHWVPLYSIQYDGNGASNTNGMGTTDSSTGVKSVRQINVGEGDSVMLLNNNFKRAGYGFGGWSTDPDAWTHFTDNDNTNDPVIYGPMETINAPAYPNNGTNIITMYALWVPAKTSGGNPVYLQDFNYLECDNLTSASYNSTTGAITASKNGVIALTDKRDNEVYTVAKLADDKCWIVENLRLEHEGTMGQNINDNSVTNRSLSQGYGGTPGTYGSFVGLAEAESSNFSESSTVANSVYKSSVDPPVDTYDPINDVLEDIGVAAAAVRFPRYNNYNTTSYDPNHTDTTMLDSTSFVQDFQVTESPSSEGTYTDGNLYSSGNYYSWAAAMANTSSIAYEGASEVVNTSICPSGWHLPSAGATTKEYNILSMRYGGTGGNQGSTANGSIISNRVRTFPNNLILSGNFANSSALGRGVWGGYWSRTSTGNYAYYVHMHSNDYSPIYYSIKKVGGLSVRCIADYRYAIQYDGNGADNPNGMGTTSLDGKKTVRQGEIAEGISITLLASNFKRAGYGFGGWSTDPDAWTHFTDNDNTNDPVIYGPMETITTPAKPVYSDTITLYAVWIPIEKDGNNNPIYLQDWDSCAALTPTVFESNTGKIVTSKNSVIALTDKRDNEVYTVARLADGRCWMTENLRLEHEGTVGNNMHDSNVTNQSLSQGYGGTAGTYGTFVGLAASESSGFGYSTANSMYKADDSGSVFNANDGTLEDIGTSYSGYRFPRYNNGNSASALSSPTYTENYNNATSPSNSGTYKTSTVLSYGNYYVWAAAMANTNEFTSSASESEDTSICPLGWHLPSSNGTAKEFGILSQGYGGTGGNQSTAGVGNVLSNRFRAFPNNFLYSGYYTGSADQRGTTGRYWSRTAYSRYYSFYLNLGSANLLPSQSDYKTTGLSVRCILDNDYTIQYNGNNATGGSMVSDGVELKYTDVYEGDTIDLHPSNYYKTGYGFVGWSTDADAWAHFTDNDNTNDPIIYGPMETITAPAHSGHIMTLYAVWVPAEEDGNNDPVYLQDFDSTLCSNLTSTTFDSTTGAITANKNSIVALTDKRDGNVYAVARLADGNCWMTENLRLEAGGTVGNNQYDSSVTNESLAQGYGGVFVGLDSSEDSTFNNYTTPTPNNIYSTTNITGNYRDYRFPRYNNDSADTSLSASYNSNGSGNNNSPHYSWYSYGNYYNWSAVMANTDHYSVASGTSGSESAGTSICPANWTLPTGGTTTKDFGNLSQQYGGTGDRQSSDAGGVMSRRFRAFPNNFIYSAFYYHTLAQNRGSRGYYWSRSAYDDYSAHYLTLMSLDIEPSGYLDKYLGASVRCLVAGS